MGLKTDAKRLENRVNDITKSREKWCQATQQLTERIRALEAANTALQEQLAAFKKDRQLEDTGPDQ
jgi:prefoldin subunit 5